MRILLDTCVIMDAVQKRAPFADDAKKIFREAAMNGFIGCITAKASTDIYYLAHRCTHSDRDTRIILTKLFALFDVLDTAALDCKKAISSSVADYEDAVMIETAVSNGIDYIVTRNTKDYKASPIPVLSPDAFLQMLEQEQNPFLQTGDSDEANK